MWLLLLACTDKSRPTDVPPGGDTADTSADSGDDTGETALPACPDGACFDACGTEVTIGPALGGEGFQVSTSPALHPRAARWVGDVGHVVDGRRLLQVAPDLTITAESAFLPFPLSLEVILGTAYAGGRDDLVTLLTADGEPYATWAARPDARLAVVGASYNRLLIATAAGVSVLDVADPLAPVEQACLPGDAWDIRVSDGFAAMATKAGVLVYDLTASPPALLATLPGGEEGGIALYGDHLVVFEEATVLYQLVTAAPPVELDRLDDPRARQTYWAPPVAGGLVLHGGDDGSWALDLTTPTLELHQTTANEAGAWSCKASFRDAAGEPSVDLAPMWRPHLRFGPGELDGLTCPSTDHPSTAPTLEDRRGDELLLGGERWRVRNVTGGEQILDRVDGSAAWFLPEGFVVLEEGGKDWNLPLARTLTFLDADGEAVTTIALDGPLVAAASTSTGLFVLHEPTPRDYGDDPPDPSEHALVRVVSAAEAHPITLPDGAAPVALAADDDGVWVVGGARALRLGLDGTLETSCDLPESATSAVASALGLFTLGASGDVLAVSRDCGVARHAALGAPLAADDLWVYLGGEAVVTEGFATSPTFWAVDPATFEEVARLPTWTAAVARGGEPVVMQDEYALLLLTRP